MGLVWPERRNSTRHSNPLKKAWQEQQVHRTALLPQAASWSCSARATIGSKRLKQYEKPQDRDRIAKGSVFYIGEGTRKPMSSSGRRCVFQSIRPEEANWRKDAMTSGNWCRRSAGCAGTKIGAKSPDTEIDRPTWPSVHGRAQAARTSGKEGEKPMIRRSSATIDGHADPDD